MITPMIYASHSPEDTQRFAREQALALTHQGKGEPLIIALEGDLGAGKTTFTQAFAEALGVNERVKSPTFVLMKHYQLSNIPTYDMLYHLDCYRLQDSSDLGPLGVRELLNRPGTIMLIEWAERVVDILPRSYWRVCLEHIGEYDRKIEIIKIN